MVQSPGDTHQRGDRDIFFIFMLQLSNMNPALNSGGHSIIWEAPEFHHNPKSSDWFWAVAIIAISMTILTFIYGNILLGILLIIGTIGIFLHADRLPVVREIELKRKRNQNRSKDFILTEPLNLFGSKHGVRA